MALTRCGETVLGTSLPQEDALQLGWEGQHRLAAPKDIGIVPIVVAELKLRDVQRGIYLSLFLCNVPTTPRLKIDQIR
jgi:hypothetical protein